MRPTRTIQAQTLGLRCFNYVVPVGVPAELERGAISGAHGAKAYTQFPHVE